MDISLSRLACDRSESAYESNLLGEQYPDSDKSAAVNLEPMDISVTEAKDSCPREYPLFMTALRTGMRLGELLGLEWGDIDFSGRFIEVRRNRVAAHVGAESIRNLGRETAAC